MSEELTIKQEQQQLQTAILNLVDLHVRKEYLSELDCARVKALSPHFMQIKPGENMRLMHLEKIAYDENTSVSEKVRNIFGSLSQDGSSSMLLINGTKDCVDVYLGIADESKPHLTGQKKLLTGAFQTAFPGAEYKNLTNTKCKELIGDLFPEEMSLSVASVSGAQLEPVQGQEAGDSLEVLIDAMKHKPFSAIILSQAMQHSRLIAMRRELEDFYTQIAPLQKQDISMSTNESSNYGITFSSSTTESQSKTTGTSSSATFTKGENSGEQVAADHSEQDAKQARNSLIGTGVTLAATLLTGGLGGAAAAGITPIFQSMFYGKSIGDAFNNIGTLKNGPQAPDVQHTYGTSTSESTTKGTQESSTDSHSESETKGGNVGKGYGSSNSCQVSYINKPVEDLLNIIDEQIYEISQAEKNGAFNTGAYFIAGDEETALTAANLYRSIVGSHGQNKTPSHVYCWSEKETVTRIFDYLKRGFHPMFTFTEDQEFQYPDVSLAQPIRIQDIPAYFCLPEKTLHGMSVVEHAAFPRDIVFRKKQTEDKKDLLNIGNIYYMGKEDKALPVNVSVNALTKHLFVAGTTGAGKSNFCYGLVDELLQRGKKVLIIEPAKGEYSKVFGGRDDFEVFGTNAALTNLLHINPFAFPLGISVDEHIEALMGIFNNAWPMYSAMPAVLKEALETIYRQKGFDMEFQTVRGDEEFPNFEDLLVALPEVIKKSDYSKEVQGNYIGALVTRVKSLTNGVYSSIFCRNESGDEVLFEGNAIIDISRIRSNETKALIMGVLVNRLSEYRSCSGVMNSPLKHITLLEEAHHLLKTPLTSGAEGANMGAASVEMISNAIAEMRTYGEGFVIADQSPATMDQSVMRNTFTKVFFNLPEREDRSVAASSLELNASQQAELSKIDTGVAVVYHREWSEPVLAKIRYFSDENMKPYQHQKVDILTQNRSILGQTLAVLLYNRMQENQQKSSYSAASVQKLLNSEFSWLGDREPALKEVLKSHKDLIKKKNSSAEIYEVYKLFFDLEEQINLYAGGMKLSKWVEKVTHEITLKADISESEAEELLGLMIVYFRTKDSNALKLYGEYKTMIASK